MPARPWLRATALVTLATAGAVTSSPAQSRRPVTAPPSAPPSAAQLSAKVGETLMGPRTQRIVISEDGDHMAIVAPKGSRQVVLIDGVEGPVFDEIPANYGWISWLNRGAPSGILSAAQGRAARSRVCLITTSP